MTASNVSLLIPISPIRNALSRLSLLLLGSPYRRQPSPTSRQSRIRPELMRCPHALSHDLEYYLELSHHGFLVYLGCYLPEYSVS